MGDINNNYDLEEFCVPNILRYGLDYPIAACGYPEPLDELDDGIASSFRYIESGYDYFYEYGYEPKVSALNNNVSDYSSQEEEEEETPSEDPPALKDLVISSEEDVIENPNLAANSLASSVVSGTKVDAGEDPLSQISEEGPVLKRPRLALKPDSSATTRGVA